MYSNDRLDIINSSDRVIEDIDHFDDEPNDQNHVSFALLVSFTVTVLVLLIAGVVGNLAAIVSILRPTLKSTPVHSPTRRTSVKHLQNMTVTNAYIISLSAADLLFLLFCAPFQGTVYILNHWPYGWFICKLAHYFQYCTVYSSVWILTVMSIDRYTAIGYPLKSVKWRRSHRAVKISVVIWLVAAMLSLPWLFLYETADVATTAGSSVTACYDGWSEELYPYRKWFLLAVACIGFIIPALIIFSMAILIAKSIHSTFTEPLLNETRKNSIMYSSKYEDLRSSLDSSASTYNFIQRRLFQNAVGERKNSIVFKRRRRACWLVFGLALIFFIFQGPQNVCLLWINFDTSAVEWMLENHEIFFALRLLTHIFTYFHAVLNPIVYGVASGRIRTCLMGQKATAKTVLCVPKEEFRLTARRRSKRQCSMDVMRNSGTDSKAVPRSAPTPVVHTNLSRKQRNSIGFSRISVPDSSNAVSATADTTFGNFDLRRVVVKHAAMRRVSSTASAFI